MLLIKRPAELRQRPHRKQIDAEDRLNACNDANPADGFKSVFARLHAANPITGVKLLEPDVHG